MTPNRLFRSRDRQLAGVAGGMADYLGIDPTISRVLWILAGLFSGGFMILVYVILAFVIPERPVGAMPTQGWTNPAGAPTSGAQAGAAPAWSPDWAAQAAAEQDARERSRGRGPGAAVIIGVILIVFGAIALADAMLPGWIGAAVFGPALLLALGAALLVGSLRRTEGERPATTASFASPASPVSPTAFATAAPAAGGYDAGGYDAGGYDAGGYDADATASVDLGPAAGTDPAQDTDAR